MVFGSHIAQGACRDFFQKKALPLFYTSESQHMHLVLDNMNAERLHLKKNQTFDGAPIN